MPYLIFVKTLRVRSTKMINTGEDGGGREVLSDSHNCGMWKKEQAL